MFGCNDNPSARHFESAWRKLLGQHQITASESSNCMNNDFEFLNVLNASSRKDAKVIQTNEINTSYGEEEYLDEVYLEDQVTDGPYSRCFDDHIAAYSAAVLEKCIIEGLWYSPLKCEKCLHVFSEDEVVEDEFINKKMETLKIKAPSRSTMEICKQAEISMRKYNYEQGKKDQIENDILVNLEIAQLYWMSDFESHHDLSPDSFKVDHKTRLIKLIIEMFIKRQQDCVCKRNTLSQHDEFIRHKLKKIVHFKGQ